MMALKIKSINWKNIDVPSGIKGNLFMVIQAVVPAYNWRFVKYEPDTYKLIIRSLGCQMCIYLSTMTVQTALEHPTGGKTQLTRRRVSAKELAELLRNPRTHTNKGYHTKGKRKKQ